MTTFNDFSSLERVVLQNIQNTLTTEVKKLITDEVNERLRIDVYGSYSPQKYKRKYQLYSKFNHRHEISHSNSKVELRYFHRAYTSEKKDLSKLIILGQQGAKAYGKDVAYYNEEYIKSYIASGAVDSTPFYKPRNFIENARKEIKKSEITNLLKKGMR